MYNSSGDVSTIANALETAVRSGYMAREYAKNVWITYLRACNLLPIQEVFKPKVVTPVENKVEEKK